MDSNFTSPKENTSQTVDTATGQAAPAEVSSQRVYGIFSKIAKKYGRFNAVSSFGTYKLWLKRLAKELPLDSTSEVLDVAGGTGDVTFELANRYRPAHIACTDLVPEMLEVADARYNNGEGIETPITFHVVDAQNISFPDNTFDAVSVAYGLRNMPDRNLALTEMLRVLKPGGRIACLEFSTPKNALWNALYRFYLKHMIPFWGKLITGDRDGFVYLSNSIKAFPDAQNFAEMFKEAGFEDIAWKTLTGGIAAIHTARKPADETS